MSSKVSVIIPTFNRRYVLQEAVDSVLSQLHREIELIVVDDGSTDGTRDLMTNSIVDDTRVRYVYQPNAGVASARNAGLDLATGDYVAFLDSDDSWKPWHLRLLLAGLDRHPHAGMIWTDTDFVDAEGATVSSSALRELMSAYRYFSLDDLFSSSSPLSDLGIEIPLGYGERRLYVGDVFSPMIMGNLVLTSSVVMRRERLGRVGRFDERIAVEDYEFFLRACRAGPVAFADIADIRYRTGTSDKVGGGPDQGLAIARGYLQVLDATLARDAERITLGPAMIAEARVHAHRWVGELELLAGSPRIARGHLANAIRLRPLQPSIVVLLFLTFLPGTVFQQMVRWRRRLRGWFRRVV